MFGIGGQYFVNDLLDCGAVGNLLRLFPLIYGRKIFVGFECFVVEVFQYLAGDSICLQQVSGHGYALHGNRGFLNLQPFGFQTAQQLALHQIRHTFGTLRCFGRFLKLIGQGLVHGKHLGIIFGDSIIADHALAAGLRQFREHLAYVFLPVRVHHQRQQVWFREIAVIMGLLF